MLQPALLGGLFAGVLSALPVVNLGNCCCLWIVGGGAIAAYLDQQRDPRPTTPLRGAQAGFLAGVFGAVIWLVLSLGLDVVLAPVRERVLEEVLRVARDVPPDARAALESARSTSALGYAVGFLLALCVGAVFSTLGGVLGALFFRNDVPPALGGPTSGF